MDFSELNGNEWGLIQIIRAFDFLYDNHYDGKEFTYRVRGNPSITFYNYRINQTISVIGDESQSWSVVIQRKKNFICTKSLLFLILVIIIVVLIVVC